MSHQHASQLITQHVLFQCLDETLMLHLYETSPLFDVTFM